MEAKADWQKPGPPSSRSDVQSRYAMPQGRAPHGPSLSPPIRPSHTHPACTHAPTCCFCLKSSSPLRSSEAPAYSCSAAGSSQDGSSSSSPAASGAAAAVLARFAAGPPSASPPFGSEMGGKRHGVQRQGSAGLPVYRLLAGAGTAACASALHTRSVSPPSPPGASCAPASQPAQSASRSQRTHSQPTAAARIYKPHVLFLSRVPTHPVSPPTHPPRGASWPSPPPPAPALARPPACAAAPPSPPPAARGSCAGPRPCRP